MWHLCFLILLNVALKIEAKTPLVVMPTADTNPQHCQLFCKLANSSLQNMCHITACNHTAVSNTTAFPYAPFIEASNIQWHTYTNDTTSKKHLALNVSWYPNQDATIERVTGYRIRLIQNDILQEEACVGLSKPLTFNNINMAFTYNCFGYGEIDDKVMLKPNTLYDIQVTSLPFDPKTKNEKTVSTISPECSIPEVSSVAECNLVDVPHTCNLNCSTRAKGQFFANCENIANEITTDLSKLTLFNITLDGAGPPSNPTWVEQKTGNNWYTYFDPISKEVKVALNFSWSPSDDASISQLRGYKINILSLDSSSINVQTLYNISTRLTFADHIKAEFFYDCFGRGTYDVEPGIEYLVYIESLPEHSSTKKDIVKEKIVVPGCADTRMEHVTSCKDKHFPEITMNIDKINCFNTSATLTYNVPRNYGDRIWRLFCKYDKDKFYDNCVEMSQKSSSKLRATVYDIQLDPNESLDAQYFVTIHGNAQNLKRKRSEYFNFTSCKIPMQNYTVPTYGIAIGLCALITLVCIGLIIFICRSKRKNKYIHEVNNYENHGNHIILPPIQSKPIEPTKLTIKDKPIDCGNKKVFVVYTDDCEEHIHVVHYFCSFLQHDLNLEVSAYLWSKHEADGNAAPWMMGNLDKADKVIVLCSEGANHALSRGKTQIGNMFTPVVREIINHIFLQQNKGKYLIAYFDYSTQKHIPKQLLDHSALYCCQFKLMKQFEDLYFKIIGQEQFQEGQIKRVEKIGLDCWFSDSRNKHGPTLKKAIDKMHKLYEENPNWFVDQHGDAEPVAPYPALESCKPKNFPRTKPKPAIEVEEPKMASIQKLSIHPPGKMPHKSNQQTKDSHDSYSNSIAATASYAPSSFSSDDDDDDDIDHDMSNVQLQPITNNKKPLPRIGSGPELSPLLLKKSDVPKHNYKHHVPISLPLPHHSDSEMLNRDHPLTLIPPIPIAPRNNVQHFKDTSMALPTSFSDSDTVKGSDFKDSIPNTIVLSDEFNVPEVLGSDSGFGSTLAPLEDCDCDFDEAVKSINQFDNYNA